MPKKITKFFSTTKQKFGLSSSSSPSSSPKKSVDKSVPSTSAAAHHSGTASTSKASSSKAALGGRTSVSPHDAGKIVEKSRKKVAPYQLVDDEEALSSDSDDGAAARGNLKLTPTGRGGDNNNNNNKATTSTTSKGTNGRKGKSGGGGKEKRTPREQDDEDNDGDEATPGGANAKQGARGDGGGLWSRMFKCSGNTALTSGSAYNELYSEDKEVNGGGGGAHWWQTPNSLLSKVRPALFGTWDGVFATCVVHLFGVISFLRTGWLVGNDGLFVSVGVVFGCLLFTTLSLLAAIGIIERCAAASDGAFGEKHQQQLLAGSRRRRQDQADVEEAGDDDERRGGDEDYNTGEYCATVASARGNVHTLISTVLGSRIGSSISVIYMVGQVVSCSLHIIGFAESFLQLLHTLIQRRVTDYIATHRVHRLAEDEDLSAVLLADVRWLYNVVRVLSIRLVIKSSDIAPKQDEAQVILIEQPPLLYFQVTTVVLLFVFLINRFGVRWVFRVQSVLFAMLVAAAADFIVGLFLIDGQDMGYGPMRLGVDHLAENLYPNFTAVMAMQPSGPTMPSHAGLPMTVWHIMATVGVFFPSSIGVMAGVNMGADLREPGRAIPVGSLAAIATSFCLHLVFILGLASVATRSTLLTDYSIGQHISALGFLFLCGLYMSAISSSLGSMYTGSRIMQALAGEMQTFSVMKRMAAGRGPNKVPNGTLVIFSLLVLVFNMSDEVNQLAPIVTILYLFTYATIEYAYFSMAMTFDIQISREKRFMAIASQLRAESGDEGDDDSAAGGNVSRSTTIQLIRDDDAGEEQDARGHRGGGDGENADLLSVAGSHCDQPPTSPTPSIQHLVGYGSVQSMTQHIKIKRRQSTQSSSSSDDSNELGAFHRASSAATGSSISPVSSQSAIASGGVKKPKTIKQLMAAVSDDESEDEDEEVGGPVDVGGGAGHSGSNIFRFDTASNGSQQHLATTAGKRKWPGDGDGVSVGGQSTATVQSSKLIITKRPGEGNSSSAPGVHDRLLNPDPEMAEIACKQEIWYLRLMNRWIILAAAVLKIMLMFIIDWRWASAAVFAYGLTFVAIGKTNPGFYPGVSEFVFVHWIRNLFGKTFK